MAFTATVIERTVFGDKRVVLGKYVNTGGSTGGDITTGLNAIQTLIIQPYGSAVVSQPVINETVPTADVPMTDAAGLTVVTNANESGTFIAIGW
jgi:hypothetical protein